MENDAGMLTLALDTTTRRGSVAVLRGDAVLSLVHGDAARTHGERLPGELDEALRRAGVAPADVQLLVVGAGPGAFTGLRIGLAAVQGLAMVTGARAIGVSALDALALAARAQHGDPAAPIDAWMDAQRGEVYAARYVAAATTADPIVLPVHQLLDELRGASDVPRLFIGDGAVQHRDAIARTFVTARVLEPPDALAPFLAMLGQRFAARGEAGPPHALQPLYVRRPDAELARAKTG